jgi:hypothetical protein
MMLHRPASRRQRQRERHAEAQRRHRRRGRDGTMMITLPITVEQVAKLYGLRYLGDCELEDRRRVAEAIIAMINSIEISGGE